MALRKAYSYSKRKVVPYTRVSKAKNKSYIKTVPPQKIVKFTMGNNKMFAEGKFPYKLIIISTESVQIRHNALESCRQFINKKLDEDLMGQYMFKILPFPHHIQRENKMIAGAGADRLQKGMQLAFGKTSGKAAILKPNTKLFFFAVQNPRAVEIVRKVLKQIAPKLPGRTRAISDFPKPVSE